MNRKLTLGMVVVFAALLVYVLVIQRPKDLAAEATPTARPTVYLWTVTPEQVSGFRIEDRVNSQVVAVSRDASGAWTLIEPGPQPAEPTAVTTAVITLAGLTVATTITSTTDFALFGVLSPTYQLQLTLVDGSQLTAAIGDQIPTGTGYYVLPAGAANVVTVNSNSLGAVLALLLSPPSLPPTATPTAALTATVPVSATAVATVAP